MHFLPKGTPTLPPIKEVSLVTIKTKVKKERSNKVNNKGKEITKVSKTVKKTTMPKISKNNPTMSKLKRKLQAIKLNETENGKSWYCKTVAMFLCLLCSLRTQSEMPRSTRSGNWFTTVHYLIYTSWCRSAEQCTTLHTLIHAYSHFSKDVPTSLTLLCMEVSWTVYGSWSKQCRDSGVKRCKSSVHCLVKVPLRKCNTGVTHFTLGRPECLTLLFHTNKYSWMIPDLLKLPLPYSMVLLSQHLDVSILGLSIIFTPSPYDGDNRFSWWHQKRQCIFLYSNSKYQNLEYLITKCRNLHFLHFHLICIVTKVFNSHLR